MKHIELILKLYLKVQPGDRNLQALFLILKNSNLLIWSIIFPLTRLCGSRGIEMQSVNLTITYMTYLRMHGMLRIQDSAYSWVLYERKIIQSIYKCHT